MIAEKLGFQPNENNKNVKRRVLEECQEGALVILWPFHILGVES